MSDFTSTTEVDDVVYPESDGKPMADNTRQFRIIMMIQGGLDASFRDDPNVFVAGDLLWYPVQGNNKVRAAPDTMVVFGRPKGDRGSYVQHREGGIAPQVVFEVLSPNNTEAEMQAKLEFYDQHGVEEYYVHDPEPEHPSLIGYRRNDDRELVEIGEMQGWLSPRLGVRFAMTDATLVLTGPDDKTLWTYVELSKRYEEADQEAKEERRRADRLAEQLRRLGIDPDGEDNGSN